MQSSTSDINVSIVICTRNRAQSLEATLAALGVMEVPSDLRWQVIVVNNGSTDATDDVVMNFAERLPLTTVFLEPPGQGQARNLGLRNSRGEVIAYIDDDCITDPRWLTELWAEFAADATLDALGGRVELFDKRDLPLTLQRWPKRKELGHGGQFDLKDVLMIQGCNMAFRRRVFAVVGEFDPRLGPGSKSWSADDTDMLYRVLRYPFRMIYSPAVLVYHNHGRRTIDAAKRLRRGYAIGRGAFYWKHAAAGDRQAIRLFHQELLRTVRPLVEITVSQARWLHYLAHGICVRMLGR